MSINSPILSNTHPTAKDNQQIVWAVDVHGGNLLVKVNFLHSKPIVTMMLTSSSLVAPTDVITHIVSIQLKLMTGSTRVMKVCRICNSLWNCKIWIFGVCHRAGYIHILYCGQTFAVFLFRVSLRKATWEHGWFTSKWIHLTALILITLIPDRKPLWC